MIMARPLSWEGLALALSRPDDLQISLRVVPEPRVRVFDEPDEDDDDEKERRRREILEDMAEQHDFRY